MKMYNDSVGKIQDLPKTIAVDGVNRFTSKMTEEELNAQRWYKFIYESKPDSRYYSSIESRVLEGNLYVISYEPVELPLETIQTRMKSDISKEFKASQEVSIVDTGLGFSVDGGRNSLVDFETGKEFGLPSVRGADNKFYPVTADDYDTIITAIKQNGVSLYQAKWAEEELIDNLDSVQACIDYEYVEPEVLEDEMV